MGCERPRLPHISCPACGGRAFARTSGKEGVLYREIYFHCRNVDACGHQFVVAMEAIRTVKPSRYPKPLAVLPHTSWHAAANDRAANDDDISPGDPEPAAMSG